MAANIDPIYSKTPDVSNAGVAGTTFAATMTTATGDYTGVSGNHVTAWLAGSNGGFIQRLRLKAIGTNTASVARVYINNGSTPGTPANNIFYGEITLPATTAINTAATVDVDYPMNFALPSGFKVLVGLGTTVAAGWTVAGVGGQY